ncbi:hypothetical protein M9H77_25158 [Catharanthus roseus]|uniref:Uncharacterized protein n=1 Tax=Catharanthus roseus TaxID=4058 RepID=A0ACC0A665_CATRO|nr:hypothetical protein M9H77_25158 [Catharanthus roseus]
MALVMRKFKRFYKKDFIKRGKNPPFRKGGQSSSLFKARCFKCNSTDHLVTDCSKAIEKEKGALEEKLEALKKKKKGKCLIGAWDQDTSESECDEKGNICFMVLENEVQASPSNSSTILDDDCDVDPSLMLIEINQPLYTQAMEKHAMEEEEIEEKQGNEQETQNLPQEVIYPKGHSKDEIIGDVSQGVRTRSDEEDDDDDPEDMDIEEEDSDEETEAEIQRRETRQKKQQERTEEGSSSGSMSQLMDMIVSLQTSMTTRFDAFDGRFEALDGKIDALDQKMTDTQERVKRLEQGGGDRDD